MGKSLESWAAFYDDIYRDLTEDIPFYLSLLSDDPSISVLEIGCGTGRITLPLSQIGSDVTGMDNSKHMLEKLKDKMGPYDCMPKLTLKNMINFEFDEKFDLVIIPFRGFQSLLRVREQDQCLESIKNVLANNGRLIINLFVPSRDMFDQKENVNYLVKEVEGLTLNRMFSIKHRTSFEKSNQIINSSINIEASRNTQIISSHWLNFQLRYLYPMEAEYLFRNNGYEPVDLIGDYSGGEFTQDSEDMIWTLKPIK